MFWPISCLVCKAPFADVLCAHCLEGLLELREPVLRDEGAYLVASLFAWRESSPPALRWLVHSLKGHASPHIWHSLAVMMCDEFGAPSQGVLVPVPARHRGHALGLAHALGDLSRCSVQTPLAVPARRTQKKLSLEQRKTIVFENPLCMHYTDVTVVDDVITTGATARAAYRALGRPRNCQVWCLLDRRPCGS